MQMLNIPIEENPIQSPQHYGDTRLMDLLINKHVPFAEGNIMKYVFFC